MSFLLVTMNESSKLRCFLSYWKLLFLLYIFVRSAIQDEWYWNVETKGGFLWVWQIPRWWEPSLRHPQTPFVKSDVHQSSTDSVIQLQKHFAVLTRRKNNMEVISCQTITHPLTWTWCETCVMHFILWISLMLSHKKQLSP